MSAEADLSKIAQLSDEELMKATWDSPSPSEEENNPDTSEELEEVEDQSQEEESGAVVDTTVTEVEEEEDDSSTSVDSEVEVEEEEDSSTKDLQDKETTTSEDKQKKAGEETSASEVDFKAFYEKIMSPIKASGRTIELKSPEEAIRLMQFGADYTRKMQALAPHRKALIMLENNGLLDEGKLSYLIDLEKKNPEAIKKLIKESGLDVLDLDLDKDPEYTGGNHKVTDEEVNLRSTLDDFKSTPEGEQFLKHIVDTWDPSSKGVLWKNPEILTVIHEQKINGVYDRISGEIDRMRTLGSIPSTVPFIQAYKQVGDMLAEQGAFDDLVKPAPTTTQVARKPVATRTRPTETVPKNVDKAKAAALTRASTTAKVDDLGKLAKASDEEFMKAMENRQ